MSETTSSLPPAGFTALTETEEWEDGIYQISTDDPVQGGPGGVSNYPAQGLANRTKFLKAATDALQAALPSYATTADLSAEAAARAAADALLMYGFYGGLAANNDKSLLGGHLNGGTGKVAIGWDGGQADMAFASDVASEAAARAAADALLMSGFYGGLAANNDKSLFGGHLNGSTGKVAIGWDGGQADMAFASDVTSEAASRAAADATLVSGTNSMDTASGDMQIFSLHYSGGTSRPMVGYGPNGADQTYTPVAWYSDITGEAATRAAADGQLVNGILAMGSTDYQCLGLHFNSAGRLMGVYNNGSGQIYPTIALYTDITSEAAARAAADADLMGGFVGGISASGDKQLYGGHLDGGSGKVAMSWDGGQADLAFASDVTSEAASRAAADAQLVSGTYGMGPGDVQILGIHTDNQGYVHVWDATGDKGMLEWHSTSDPSLKANMTPVMPDVLGDLDKIRMYSFDWKDGYVRKGHVPVGFSSKNLLEVWPDTVRTSEKNPDSIELLNLIAKQMAAIKQLKDIVAELRSDVAALKAGTAAHS